MGNIFVSAPSTHGEATPRKGPLFAQPLPDVYVSPLAASPFVTDVTTCDTLRIREE